MVQGTELAPGLNADGSADGSDVVLRDVVIDRRSGGDPRVAIAALQVSWDARVVLRRFYIRGGAGVEGDGIQLAGPNVEAELSSGIVSGFNGTSAVGLRLVEGARVNDDVEHALFWYNQRVRVR
jgi:hypothetical protein